jgi:hypothetical protein
MSMSRHPRRRTVRNIRGAGLGPARDDDRSWWPTRAPILRRAWPVCEMPPGRGLIPVCAGALRLPLRFDGKKHFRQPRRISAWRRGAGGLVASRSVLSNLATGIIQLIFGPFGTGRRLQISGGTFVSAKGRSGFWTDPVTEKKGQVIRRCNLCVYPMPRGAAEVRLRLPNAHVMAGSAAGGMRPIVETHIRLLAASGTGVPLDGDAEENVSEVEEQPTRWWRLPAIKSRVMLLEIGLAGCRTILRFVLLVWLLLLLFACSLASSNARTPAFSYQRSAQLLAAADSMIVLAR